LRSTARDMVRYVQAQQAGMFAGVVAAQTKHAIVSDDMDVGFAWHIFKQQGDEIVWHNGGTGGFRSFVGFSKQTGLGVVILSNTSSSVDDMGFHLLGVDTPELLK
jgi:serine-type D-Ala-D-Ala carboxypeptidase/endopeptidase